MKAQINLWRGKGRMCTHLIFAVALLMLSASSVSKADLVNSNFIVIDDIEYYIQTDKAVYNLGEDVESLFRVTNFSDETLSIGTSHPVLDIIVFEKEGESFNEIWNWSWDEIYPQGPVLFKLEPGESRELGCIWPQIDLNGSVEIEDHTPVPPGIFRVSGNCNPTDTSVYVDISIVPEPSSLALFAMSAIALVRYKRKS